MNGDRLMSTKSCKRGFFAPLFAAFALAVVALAALHSQPALAAADLALNRPATASSSESWGLEPAKANDGDSATRWSSSFRDGERWRVDLGSAQLVDQIRINWEVAHASSYELQLSRDGSNYTTVWSGGTSEPGWKVHDFAAQEARYVRFAGGQRATQWGFSFWDFVVYNIGGSSTGDSASKAPATLRPVGSPPLTDAQAASRVRRDPWEPRPENSWYNHRTPTQAELDRFHSHNPWSGCESLHRKVTGNFTGTTDEIIQWAAHKWGFPEDEFRAIAVSESWWRQSAGGWNGGGLMSVTSGVLGAEHLDPEHGLYRTSTAFNADFFGAYMRYYFEGCATWLNNLERGWDYHAGDMWGSFGVWFSGRWYNDGAHWYIAKVRRELAARTWEGF